MKNQSSLFPCYLGSLSKFKWSHRCFAIKCSLSVSKSMLITFTIFITTIFHVSDILFKTFDGTHTARGGTAWQEGLKVESGVGDAATQARNS